MVPRNLTVQELSDHGDNPYTWAYLGISPTPVSNSGPHESTDGKTGYSVHIIRKRMVWQCENIQSWISLSGDLAFCHQHGIYGFKNSPAGFCRSLPEISLSFLTFDSFDHLKTDY